MKKYEHIVVGSGISGLTLALLLSANGKNVLLLEKGPAIGGSLRRFYKQNVPFDTGFHFTGGFASGGILSDMLHALGIDSLIKPIYLREKGSGVFIFEKEGIAYDLPSGTDNFSNRIQDYFPGEKQAIRDYFTRIKKVYASTVSLDLRKIGLAAEAVDEDFQSLQSVLDELTPNKRLQALLSAFCVCYGVKPAEVSFANHARVSGGLYESVARIENGGDAFIRAFQGYFKKSGIDILCNSWITACGDVKDDKVGEFVLNNGAVVKSDHCTFTIHPQEIVKILPQQYLRKAFMERVGGFETSHGFFSVSAIVEGADSANFGPSIASLLPDTDLNTLLDPGNKSEYPLAVIRSCETGKDGKKYCVVNAFEPEFYSNLAQWADSSVGKRPAQYYEYKERKAQRIKERFAKAYPQHADGLRVLDVATVLTFRDYLFSPQGNAYGIKQKMGQFNLFGKLPLVNIYVAGQSAVLPGIVGAMLSSFIVARSMLGKENFNRFIEGRLAN